MVTKLSSVGQVYPDVLRPFLKDYSSRLSASDIAREVNIERRTVSRILNKLVKLNLMDYIIHGKNKLFYFDLGKFSTLTFFMLILDKM